MDPLRRDDIDRERRTTPEERAKLAFEAMDLGIRLKRDSLRRRFSSESPEAIENRLADWLLADRDCD
jgi:hypothetical protein